MGHMANGAHGQWGLWAMGPMGNAAHGPMGDWDIFAHSIIITGWILTKILLIIDIDVFYLNTGRFLHNGSFKGIFRMDFKFVVCSSYCSDRLISYAEIP